MKIAVHFPVFKRYKETDMAAKALKRLLKEYEELGYTSQVYAAGTTNRDREICEGHGFTYIHTVNTPVGEKFHQLAKYIYREDEEFDWYMEYCSDNVCAPGFARLVQDQIDLGVTQVYTHTFYMVTWHDKVAKRFRGGHSNVGRMTRADVFRQVMKRYGQAYGRRLDNRLDANFRKRAKNQGAVLGKIKLPDDQPMVLDVKTDLSMHRWEGYDTFWNPVVPLVGNFPEFYEIHKSWQSPPQAKSGPTKSASTSAPPASPTPAPPPAEPTATTPPPKTTPSSSSPAPRPVPSPARSKSSTRRRKTTTGKGKSSQGD